MFNFIKKLFADIFSQPKPALPTPGALWLNIGYHADDGTFIILPVGTPLDSIQKVSTNTGNQRYGAIKNAQNNLLEQLLEAGEYLDSGESRTVELTVQLRKTISV